MKDETHIACFICLEQALLYVDFGLSDSTAMFLAGSRHVCFSVETFQRHATEWLVSRWKLTQPPLHEPQRQYPWQ
jgi:hypothetical protein